MSWLLAFAAFAALVVLHELGHFFVAKAVGMRVERFALFFPPLIFRVRRGETEYGIGAIPLGGYVKITGMRPDEDVAPEHLSRAYFNQPAWKRIAVIAAGPLVNVVIAVVLVFALFQWIGISEPTSAIVDVDRTGPSAASIEAGDRLVGVNGVRGEPQALAREINRSKCAGARVDGCAATAPLHVWVLRDGKVRSFDTVPRFDADAGRMRLGIRFGSERVTEPFGTSVSRTWEQIWFVTKTTLSLPARLVDPVERKEISSSVGGYEATRQAIKSKSEDSVWIIALISLSLALINLFPFLPLDGGHIFWTIVEKLRGRPVPAAWLDRASAVGLALIVMLFMVGLSNDIDRLRNGGFGH